MRPRGRPHPERDVERERPGRDRGDRNLGLIAHLHYRAFAVLPLDLTQSGVESLLTLQGVQPPNDTDSKISYCAPPGRRREIITAASDGATSPSSGSGGSSRGGGRERGAPARGGPPGAFP